MQELVRKLNELNESFDIMYENRPLTNIYCRIFNADFNHGGRYYKADILQMSNSETPRIDIKIDGESVVEVDFNNLHIRLAAAEHGLLDKLPDDPYAIDGGREFDRKIVKMAVNIMLNAKKRKSAILALAGSVDFDGSMFENAADVVAFVEKRLSFMKEVFFQPDSYGLYLQSLDSRIASLVIKSFVDIGEAILPVHDSFVVRKDMMAYLVVAMQDAFRAVTSVDCSVPLTAKSRLWQGDDAYIQIEKFR